MVEHYTQHKITLDLGVLFCAFFIVVCEGGYQWTKVKSKHLEKKCMFNIECTKKKSFKVYMKQV